MFGLLQVVHKTSSWRCSEDVGQLLLSLFFLATQLLFVLETDHLFSFWETSLFSTHGLFGSYGIFSLLSISEMRISSRTDQQ